MKKLLLPFGFLLFVFVSCTNADPKKMASELCDCFTSKKKISSKTKKIVVKASNSDNFQNAIQEGLQAIEDQEEQQKVSDEINRIASSFTNSKTQECANEIDKKYRVMKSDSLDIQRKMIDEMDNVDGCEVYAAFVQAGMKKKARKNNDDETTSDEEEDAPKKKKRTNKTEEE